MHVIELRIEGAWLVAPQRHTDGRGVFVEIYQADQFRGATGFGFDLAQVNCSVSRRGSVRGIHYAELPPSQAKYVTCLHGAVLDVVVDIRVGSPTFGEWDSVLLDAKDCKAVYVPEGLGHAFMAITDDATVSYLCSQPYAPSREHGINPLDPALDIDWPTEIEPLLSARDAEAPTLDGARSQGLLPSYEACVAFYNDLRSRGTA